MENLSAWFRAQLTSSAEALTWAVEQVPEERRLLVPPYPENAWPVAQHVFHMMYYESKLALPCMGLWLGKPFQITEEEYQEEQAWQLGHDLQTTLADFRRIRDEEIALLEHFDEETWHRTFDTEFWGTISLRWFVSKTLQHTFEHTHDVLAIALFWHPEEEQEQPE